MGNKKWKMEDVKQEIWNENIKNGNWIKRKECNQEWRRLW